MCKKKLKSLGTSVPGFFVSTPAFRMTVYGLLLIASPLALAPVPTAHVYSASGYSIVSMQGHDGLFARQLPIASTCFAHLDI